MASRRHRPMNSPLQRLTAEPACNGVQDATTYMAFVAMVALWNLQVTESTRSCRVRIPPSPPFDSPSSRLIGSQRLAHGGPLARENALSERAFQCESKGREVIPQCEGCHAEAAKPRSRTHPFNQIPLV